MLPIPHGGKLVNRFLDEKSKSNIISELPSLKKIELSKELAFEVENISTGLFSPLQGFMGEEEVESVVENMRLPDDTPWTIPIVFDYDDTLGVGERVAFTYQGEPFAVFDIEEKFTFDRERMAQKVFGTIDTSHPGVKEVLGLKEYLYGGKIFTFRKLPDPNEKFALTPKETRVLFESKGWKRVVAFQTRNVPHLGHEYVQKTALTFVDGIFINPVIGKKKKGDFKDEVILEAYRVLIDNYYLKDTAVLGIWNTRMRYAGPREAIFHAIVRKNYGCTHFIVGRDHAGVGNFYPPYAAQEIFDHFPDLGITPVFFREFFYCKKCGTITNSRVCPHPDEDRVNFSGTKIRNMLISGEDPSPQYMRPEVVQVIRKFSNPFVD